MVSSGATEVSSPPSSQRRSSRLKRPASSEEPEPSVEETPKSASKKKALAKNSTFIEAPSSVDAEEIVGNAEETPKVRKRAGLAKSSRSDADTADCCFVGEPVPLAEAQQRWPQRYAKKGSNNAKSLGDEDDLLAKCHYLKAKVDGTLYDLNDDAYVKADDGNPNYICRIAEFFETADHQLYFAAQWFFRVEDTVIKEHAHLHGNKAIHDNRRVFRSEEKNDNPLDCLVAKIRIVRVDPNIDLVAKKETIPPCDLYYDMSYSLSYSTFANLPPVPSRASSEASSSLSSESLPTSIKTKSLSNSGESSQDQTSTLYLLDLYSGCGAMSTGLCLGANLSGTNLVTRWAVDFNKYACESLKLNHPETEVRHEKTEDFLSLLKEWELLCKKYNVIDNMEPSMGQFESTDSDDEETNDASQGDDEFEVRKLVGICYGDPNSTGKVGLKFKVRWKGYGPSADTWEPIDGLDNCQERIHDFVKNGYNKRILPLPGKVDVVCGGPPCQGISGFNRFRDRANPLNDEKNRQMAIYMDIVEFLKPRYALMENVVDILKFANGYLGRYALSRFVSMNYQARMGMMVAGCYGLPQFRIRFFLWGALPSETLPQFPLPTHDVVVRGGYPTEFEQNMVAYNENQRPDLQKALLLSDAISDLPEISNHDTNDEMAYSGPPKTEFQQFIRLKRKEVMRHIPAESKLPENHLLYDHRSLQLNEDDFLRVCQIPKKKGANFRDLPGVLVGSDNTVQWDPKVERVLLPSGKPLIPDYAMSFRDGKSTKPFARLWWDESVPTVVTRAEPHNQAVCHPLQDRVLSIRENARLQGFPDYYKLSGPVKERYIQVGNAVAVPVARALGYALGLALQNDISFSEPIFILPPKFPRMEQDLGSSRAELVESVVA